MNRRRAIVSLCLLALFVLAAVPAVAAITPTSTEMTRAQSFGVRTTETLTIQYRAALQIGVPATGSLSGTGTGSSYLCMWDSGSGESGQDGNLYDTELDDYVGSWSAGRIFIFVDHCYSGGLIPEIQVLSNSAKVYMTTTCTQNGYGYDDSSHLNCAWTYYFLEYGLINHFGSSTSTTMESCFTCSLAAFPYSGGDTPQQFDGNTGTGFTL